MAIDAGETFESVDLSGETGGFEFTVRGVVTALVVAGLLGAYLYDYFLVEPLYPLVAGWDVTSTDWLFLFSLAFMALYVVAPLAERPGLTRRYWAQFRKSPLAVFCLGVVGVVLTVGVLGPIFLKQPELHVFHSYQPPLGVGIDNDLVQRCVGTVSGGKCYGSMQYPLGTNAAGKSILRWVVYGARTVAQVTLICSMLIAPVATGVGTFAALTDSRLGGLVMRYVDIQQVIPAFLVYLLVQYMWNPNIFFFLLVFGLLNWGGLARIVRSEALSQAEEEYVSAARNAGAGTGYIVRRHLVPNVSNTVLTGLTTTISTLILAEAAVSFLKLQDPTVLSWGGLIYRGLGNIFLYWWIAVVPAAILILTAFSFKVVGDTCRDALDPRLD